MPDQHKTEMYELWGKLFDAIMSNMLTSGLSGPVIEEVLNAFLYDQSKFKSLEEWRSLTDAKLQLTNLFLSKKLSSRAYATIVADNDLLVNFVECELPNFNCECELPSFNCASSDVRRRMIYE